ncbi:hypothetical protein [Escherichia phage vB_EcoM_LMP25]|uniref:Uncharacterized protein n=1 Tax=Escherichia phage vB_EcoM_LMP25 TaxID=2491663 RepID=A0A482MSP5_9CAUD|nr:hypothetical protein [Escherichia phage vB_EcoM_LMP34]QBQ76217.1 hypothetical protein [Escherichia phage vB_EcoM_LMP33]QBQ76303.1 hypothetical protein [Escherichia phage vB_EcoM_LMP25]
MQVEFCREICRENFELQRENSFSNCADNLQRAFSFSKRADHTQVGQEKSF